ncbi:MAG: nicotinate-nucleotide adenylyltransferase [Firmicutes bacterium]|nr:nicotinate-nucleotide adenylyltransferase [Bacillota bacterium]MDD4692845.1 nicotinate-nucleotide adenylyltransferase [Bacillota bacterium]
MRIGILGGTFDPIHWGHLFMAEIALETLKLDEVYFAPAKVPPHKKVATASPLDRLTLVELSIRENPNFKIGLWDYNHSSYAYTYESIKEVRRLFPQAELYFLVGADSIRDFHTWKNPEEIVKYCKVVGLKRPGVEYVESEFIKTHADKFILIDCPPIGISSSDIRRRIKEGKSVRYYLHPEAYKYIKTKKLYTF